MKNHLSGNNKRPGSGKFSLEIIFRILLIYSISLFITGCDLFGGPADPDYLKKIDEEIAWANASKLAVRLDYDFPSWGSSNPVRGPISQSAGGNLDLRKGYPFTIEFTPDPAYSVKSWLVYTTESLDALEGNWIEDNELLDGAELLTPGEISLPDPDLPGNIYSFIVNTTKPVTLIPWCRTEPRITRTEPRGRLGQTYSVASDIIIYFNGPLNTGTIKFAEDEDDEGIWITAESLESGIVTNLNKSSFTNFTYDTQGGFFTVTIRPSTTLPPLNSLITVRLRGITNTDGEALAGNEYEFSYQTKHSSDVGLDSYDATYTYNESARTGGININWNVRGADRIVTYYRLDNGANISLTDSSAAGATINNAAPPDYSGIQQGREPGGIREYRIFIELYKDGVREYTTNFSIWNIPDMYVTHDNTVLLDNNNIRTALVAEGSSGKNFVLTENIAIEAPWMPVGSGTFSYDDLGSPYISEDADPFQGKFYGNGHTITFSGVFDFSADYSGFFGLVLDAEIYDLTIYHANTSITIPSDRYYNDISFGSIAGYAAGTTVISNCIISGAMSINSSAQSGIGGIVGFAGSSYGGPLMEVDVSFMNCYVSVNITNNQIENFILFGGLVGDLNTTGIVNGITVNGNLETLTNYLYGYTVCGGIIGNVSKGTLDNCVFRGKISIPSAIDFIEIGGLAGNVWGSDISISRSSSSGNLDFTGPYELLYIGGFAGRVQGSNIKFEDCTYEWGEIKIDGSTESDCIIGGFAGWVSGSSEEISFINCISRASAIVVYISKTNVIWSNNNIATGGFAGTLIGNISDCYSETPVSVTYQNNTSRIGNYYTGGFVGLMDNQSKINNCYSLGNVLAEYNGTQNDDIYTGGFAGYMGSSDTLEHCFAAGAVTARSENSASQVFAGGVIGYNSGGTVTSNAALGTSVTALGGSTQIAGRIYGDSYTSGSGNYAVESMRVEEDSDYTKILLDNEAPSIGPGDPDDLHGGTVSASAFHNQGIWSLMGFTTAYWNFGSLVRDGHPRLKWE